MLSKFEVRNYKNFKDTLTIDFGKVGGYQYNLDCITNNKIGKMLIYGRNATGKTNLGKALMDIKKMLSGSSLYSDEAIVNANSDDNCAHFSYTFEFGNNIVIYRYDKYSSSKLANEELLINNMCLYAIDFENKEYCFPGLDQIQAETINVKRYILALHEIHGYEPADMSLPFLRWLINNTVMQQDSILLQLADFVNRMAAVGTGFGVDGFSLLSRSRAFRDSFVESLENPDVLQKFEGFLNLMGVLCKLKVQRLPDGKPELYFDYQKPLPFFENASSGTSALVQMYRTLNAQKNYSFLYIDEFDAFYHYEMADNMLRYFKQYHESSQVIMTSHNTNLMTNRYMRPDCLFILSSDGEITPLNEATGRELREGHNLEKMYISGEFKDYE